MLRILHLLSQKPEGTGSGVTVQALIREADKEGHRTHLLACLEAGEDLPHSMDTRSCSVVEFSTDALPFRVVGMSDVMPYESTRFSELSAVDLSRYEECFTERLRDAVERFRPHIIHCHHLWILTSLARRIIPGLPMVATCHGSDLRQFHLCPSLRETVLSGCSRLDAVLVLSQAQKREVRELYGIPDERLEVTGIGYQESLFREREKDDKDGIRILYAGKLSRAKGILWLQQALKAREDLPWHLHIAGSGTGREAAEVQDEGAGMAPRVTFHGALPQARLAEVMQKAHIFVLPSFYEGFPLVLVEALACGCRLIATELPGVKEVFLQARLGNLLSLVPLPAMTGPDTPLESHLPSFVKALEAAIVKQISLALHEKTPLRSSTKDFLGTFTWKRVFERVHGVYRRLLP